VRPVSHQTPPCAARSAASPAAAGAAAILASAAHPQHRTAALLCAGALLALTALAGCGGDSASNEQAAGNAGPGIAASIRLADCSDWQRETVTERLATIKQLGIINGAPISGAGRNGSVLTDEAAYKLFQGYCKLPFAAAFRLYKLYGRSAGLVGQPAG